jgi:tetraacyldisaccharide 4'-kinase
VPRPTLAARLQAIWYGAATPPWPLRALARLFGLVVRLRRAAYERGVCRSQRLSRPVIVVGNLTVGGSGKTPLVIWLARRLGELGLHPGVVLRGHGGRALAGGVPQAVTSDSDAAVVGDEAVLLQRRTGVPVVVGRDRVSAAQRLLSAGVDVIIADDGLQHLRLARDFEIAVIDAVRGFGNRHLLPAGPLREPPERLRKMDAIVLNAEERGPVGTPGAHALQALGLQIAFVMQLSGEWLQPLAGTGEPLALSSLAGRRVHAVAGIGNPQRFFAQLSAAGLEVVEHAFPDHHCYRAAELEFDDGLPVLMTEKDAVKCRSFAAANRWYLPVAASFAVADAQALLARLQRCLAI